jgi:hypothetical protein
VCWILREVFDLEPKYINASTARKTCGIKIKRGQKAKAIVLEHILENEKKFKAEYTKKGNPVKGVYDKADSLVIARAGYYLKNKESRP